KRLIGRIRCRQRVQHRIDVAEAGSTLDALRYYVLIEQGYDAGKNRARYGRAAEDGARSSSIHACGEHICNASGATRANAGAAGPAKFALCRTNDVAGKVRRGQ